MICINTKVGVDGCIGVKCKGGGQEGKQKRRGLAVCVQNPCGTWLGNPLHATSTCVRLGINLSLTQVQRGLTLVSEAIDHLSMIEDIDYI